MTVFEWDKALFQLEKESHNGKEITIIRNDKGFNIPLYYEDEYVSTLGIFRSIREAYNFAVDYLSKHNQVGFYYV